MKWTIGKICKVCNKDHSKKNEGPLTICELEGYVRNGSTSNYRTNNKRYSAFGAGNRYQHE